MVGKVKFLPLLLWLTLSIYGYTEPQITRGENQREAEVARPAEDGLTSFSHQDGGQETRTLAPVADSLRHRASSTSSVALFSQTAVQETSQTGNDAAGQGQSTRLAVDPSHASLGSHGDPPHRDRNTRFGSETKYKIVTRDRDEEADAINIRSDKKLSLGSTANDEEVHIASSGRVSSMTSDHQLMSAPMSGPNRRLLFWFFQKKGELNISINKVLCSLA